MARPRGEGARSWYRLPSQGQTPRRLDGQTKARRSVSYWHRCIEDPPFPFLSLSISLSPFPTLSDSPSLSISLSLSLASALSVVLPSRCVSPYCACHLYTSSPPTLLPVYALERTQISPPIHVVVRTPPGWHLSISSPPRSMTLLHVLPAIQRNHPPLINTNFFLTLSILFDDSCFQTLQTL